LNYGTYGMNAPMTPTSSPSEWETLLHDAKNGCDESVKRIFEDVYDYLILAAGRRIGDGLQGKFGASDVVQDGLSHAYTGLDKFRGSSHAEFRAWVRTIVFNSLRDQARRYEGQKRKVDREHPLSKLILADDNTPSHIAVQNEERVMLQRHLSKLPPLEQRVIEMRHRFGYRFAEIADILSISESRARTCLKNGILKLQRRFKDDEQPFSRAATDRI